MRTYAFIALAAAGLSAAYAALASAEDHTVVVTATRNARPALEVPASIDRVQAEDIEFARPKVNLSESLPRVPGLVVQNRQNYAQDLQISSRGFGARSTFGIRGLRLLADGIPASMPDGQGQVSNFDLGSAERIEVLRGPFAVMYGNASGGVINVLTASGARDPGASADLSFGSFGSWRAGVKAGGVQGNADWIVSGSRFHTDGFRDHSAATRDQLNAKATLGLGGATSLALVANAFDSPETQDPLGLTRAQANADPRQAASVASIFNTRKSVRQNQFGATLTHGFSDNTLAATAYYGERDVRQYLGFPGGFANSSGGVVDLDRGYGGASLRLENRGMLLGRPLTLTLGAEYERMAERRRGFVNSSGNLGALRRDEDDAVSSSAAYAQAEWKFAERWLALAGLRSGRVDFRSKDHFITPTNPDDSGAQRYDYTSPVAGLLYRISSVASAYVNLGRGFETPTFAELAYRPGATGLNFGLAASRSRHVEVGLKTLIAARTRVNLAAFDIETDNEIVVDTNSGGRSTFKNAGRTRRNGVELGVESALPLGFEGTLAWTLLEATFHDTFTSGTPAVTVPAGNVLPGVPHSSLYGELRWRYLPLGLTLAIEAQRKARVAVNDLNTEFADAYTIYGAAVGFAQERGRWRFAEFLRIDNLSDRRYVGSVIANESNERFYEPAPGRTATVGVKARLAF